jgi:ferredoxin
MNIPSLKLVYFSPTGTTRAVVRGIARGIHPGTVEEVDITAPRARKEPLQASADELLVVGVPVYMGRVPALLTEWLNAIQAHRTPTVCVVVYGNRVYEDALLELKKIVMKCGGIPVAGAAFIGEHSFSDAGTPIAPGRPDEDDLRRAEEFGQKIREKLRAVPPVTRVHEVTVPGIFPFRGDPRLWAVDFIAVSDACNQCGTCAEQCPVGAIDGEDSRLIDTGICISCCACIRNCPESARSMKPGLVKDAQLRLHTLCSGRKEPEWFL